MSDHELKCWPDFFTKIVHGEKTGDVRKNDRNYQIGDTLRFLEFNPDSQRYTGREFVVDVTDVLRPSEIPGIHPDYVMLSIKMPYVSTLRFVPPEDIGPGDVIEVLRINPGFDPICNSYIGKRGTVLYRCKTGSMPLAVELEGFKDETLFFSLNEIRLVEKPIPAEVMEQLPVPPVQEVI